jgi:hypothetical protein
MQFKVRPLMLLLFLVIASCAARGGLQFVEYDKRLQQLDKERTKLKTQSDPVDRTKTHIKISEILLTLVTDAVKNNDMELMEHRLDEYVTTIQDAHETMVKTGRDAHRKPKGFKELEITLRRQARQLEDIGGTLTFDQREPVEKARTQAVEIRDNLLKLLFGGTSAPGRAD